MKIRALIIDDEPLARERIKQLLVNENDVEIVGESPDGLRAIYDIRKKEPDLIFLDIQMPEMDGFDVLEMIDTDYVPQVIFVTAYDKYAIRAFEVHALDYLLKPFDKERFKKALNRAVEHIKLKKNDGFESRLDALIDEIKPERKSMERLLVKTGGRIYFIRTDEIDWIESAGNYVILHTTKEKHMIRDTMRNMEKKLDSNKFIRIHRSAIVNVSCIKEIQPYCKGESCVLLKDGTQLPLSRKYRDNLIKKFDGSD